MTTRCQCIVALELVGVPLLLSSAGTTWRALAAMIDFVNDNRYDHILTIEDPIEFVHESKKCLVNQREVHRDTHGFNEALRAALREDPDVILVGELRDLETIRLALTAAETGHLVFGTLHTSSAAKTVDRIVDQFAADRQAQIRTMLASSLKGVVSQTLCKRKAGGRVAALEIMVGTTAVAANIREAKTHQIVSAMQIGAKQGMRLLNDSLLELVRNGEVDGNEAYLKAVNKDDMMNKLASIGLTITPGATGDQHRFPCDRTIGKNTSMRGHDWNTQAGAHVKRCIFRQGRRARSIDSEIFGGATKSTAELRLINPDSLPDPLRRDTLADGLDHTGSVTVWNYLSRIE